MSEHESRRTFLKTVGAASGAAVVAPLLVGCGASTAENPEPTTPVVEPPPTPPPVDPMVVPTSRPDDWDPIAFNRDRGNAGAIPETYREDINGEDGETAHLGKHLPFVPELEGLPAEMLPLMWGNPELGHVRHPNAPVGTAEYERGHWYDWVRVRKAVDDDSAEELETRFTGWPEIGEGDNGAYDVLGGGDITADGGRNTVYIVQLPADVSPGDTIRIHAHCLYHGEYVDFLTI